MKIRSNDMGMGVRDERDYCPTCGQCLSLHHYMPANATEPEEYICPKETHEVDERRDNEPIDNIFGELGYWAGMDIEF